MKSIKMICPDISDIYISDTITLKYTKQMPFKNVKSIHPLAKTK